MKPLSLKLHEARIAKKERLSSFVDLQQKLNVKIERAPFYFSADQAGHIHRCLVAYYTTLFSEKAPEDMLSCMGDLINSLINITDQAIVCLNMDTNEFHLCAKALELWAVAKDGGEYDDLLDFFQEGKVL